MATPLFSDGLYPLLSQEKSVIRQLAAQKFRVELHQDFVKLQNLVLHFAAFGYRQPRAVQAHDQGGFGGGEVVFADFRRALAVGEYPVERVFQILMENVELRLVCVEIFFVGDDACHRNQRFGVKRLPPCFH